MDIFLTALFLLVLAADLYLIWALRCVEVFRREIRRPLPPHHPFISVLKPLCGDEPGLYENLQSICLQDYPSWQVIFGIADEDDSAIPVVRRIMAEFPQRDLRLVIDSSVSGPNRKASNLANMVRFAEADLLVISDSDMRFERDYLAAAAAPFDDPETGAATSLFSGLPDAGVLSRLVALNLSDWFLPAVLVARSFWEIRFCIGATMAIRRNVLEEIGGFENLSAYLADDYQLGRFTVEAGYRVRLMPQVVNTVVHEPDLRSFLGHEIRWARTVRVSEPVGYSFSFLANNALSLGVLYLVLSGFGLAGWILCLTAFGLRVLTHFRVRELLTSPLPSALWLMPLCDFLSFFVWAAGLSGRRISWRGNRFIVRRDGRLEEQSF